MTLRLMLLRHAKSDRPAGVADEGRPLAERGRRDSARMGRHIVRKGLLPDLALVSTARRADETWRAASCAFDQHAPARNEPRLYEASSRELLELVAHRGLRHPVRLTDLGLNPVSPQVRQRYDHGREQPQNRRPRDLLRLVSRLIHSVHVGTQLENFVSRETCCMIHPGRLVSED